MVLNPKPDPDNAGGGLGMFFMYRLGLVFYLIGSFILPAKGCDTPKPLVVYIHETIYHSQQEHIKKLCPFPLSLKPFSGSDLLKRVLQEGSSGEIDIVMGMEGEQADTDALEDLAETLPQDIFETVQLPFLWEHSKFLPMSYAYLAFLYDAHYLKPPLDHLSHFLRALPVHGAVMPDPRTSMLGRGALSWIPPQSYSVLHQKIRTYPKGWSGTFALFKGRKVPVMLGYTTSVLWHHKHKQFSVKAALFKDSPHPVQVMVAFAIKKTKRHLNALPFLRLLLSPDYQKGVLSQYSYPVIKKMTPPAYERLRPKQAFVLRRFSKERLREWMKSGYQK